MASRSAHVTRETRETRVEAELALAPGEISIDTGIPFLDHMLDSLCRHGGFTLRLEAEGDLAIDDHHSAEDCALVLGQAIDEALGDRRGIARFGFAYAPLDEALARAVVDLSGRPFSHIELGLRRERLGSLACENVAHVFSSLAIAARATVHVELLRGENDHHRAEAAFKALALALRMAVTPTGTDEIPSTKGVL